jgi:AcrR family transcriptional regulator
VALRLFSESGFAATTVKAISQEAGVTKGAFYHHFESKEDVLRQIHAEYAGQMVLGAREVAARTDLPPARQLWMLIERAVIALGRHRAHVAVFYQENRFLSEQSYSSIQELHDEQATILLDIIYRADAAGELRPGIEAKILLVAISGMTAWIYQWYQPGGPLSLDEIATSLTQIILEPVLVGSGRSGDLRP